MLVYANHLELDGDDAYKAVFASLCGWLKRKTGAAIRPKELMGSNKLNFDSIWIATETANDKEPYLYSVIVKHPDELVRGRQWIVELGIAVTGEKTNVSVVLKTDEISSLVKSDVFTTRPLLVKYIAQNAELGPGTVGVSIKSLDGDRDSYKALLYDIERVDRDYPIILVSPKQDGSYPVDLNWLQEQLLGLGQVVKISREFNSYDMEEILSQRFSAWDGAVNVIYTPLRNGYVRTKLFKSIYLDENFPEPKERISLFLSTITHNTNVPNIRKQIRSDGVKAKALRERFLARIKNNESTDNEDIEALLEIAANQEEQFKNDVERIEIEKLLVEEERDEFERQLSTANWNVDTLKRQLQASGQSQNIVNTDLILNAACRIDEPTPDECVSIIESAFSDKVIFLESARASARESLSFKRGRILLDMLKKLITEYLPLYLEGGDNKARVVFTNKQYAANESETVVNNSDLAKTREFTYRGERVYMWQHLKVGIAGNAEHTIRVHFLVDQQDMKIIIGYCGEHLPLLGK